MQERLLTLSRFACSGHAAVRGTESKILKQCPSGCEEQEAWWGVLLFLLRSALLVLGK